MSIEDINYEINQFLETYFGTAIGESVKNWRDNTSSDEGIIEIYHYLEENGYIYTLKIQNQRVKWETIILQQQEK